MDAPPCLALMGLNDCNRRHYAETVLNHWDFAQEWAGWKMRGRWLIAPDGERVNPERLRGLLFVESLKPKARFTGEVFRFARGCRQAMPQALAITRSTPEREASP